MSWGNAWGTRAWGGGAPFSVVGTVNLIRTTSDSVTITAVVVVTGLVSTPTDAPLFGAIPV